MFLNSKLYSELYILKLYFVILLIKGAVPRFRLLRSDSPTGPRRLANPAAELLPHGVGPAWPPERAAVPRCRGRPA